LTENLWNESLALLRGLSDVPSTTATVDLLELARPRWEKTVIARTSMHDLLFTCPDDPYPFHTTVRVSRSGADAFEFQLVRGGQLLAADRATDKTALAVLDAFLMQLADT
jgi:hypothetical protein